MKLTAPEEYGLRCLLRLADQPDYVMTVSEIATREALSAAYVGKLMRTLRQAGLVSSRRGQRGGFQLARPPAALTIAAVLEALGGRLFSDVFCSRHCGDRRVCVRDGDCSIRALWSVVDGAVQSVLGHMTLADLGRPERAMTAWLRHRFPATASPTADGLATPGRRAL